ncbi:MAG: FmdE family protein [Syntrophobacterales bacterium]|jgi:formylmethanofuran dehydrogenase subunit E|nr:FmdE family protein [Syntrophobacterales bacterium]
MEQAVNTKTSLQIFEDLLAGSVAAHGHLCPGQVVGVRMALLGLRLLDFEAPPTYPQLKQLIVFVEMDRCTGDAVAYVTNAKLGRRSLKFVDYGIMAATFINLETGRAYRIISTEESRDLAPLYAPQEHDKRSQQLEAYRSMPDSVLFRVHEVEVDLTPYDLPGPTRRKVACAQCGQVVRDHREVIKDGQPLCRPCAGGVYFKNAREIIWETMDWSPQTQVQMAESPAHLSRFILSKRPH